MGIGAPSGTVTFLFTDIEGSTRLWQQDEAAMRSALERHDAILRSAIDGHGGYVFSTGGDGFGAAFARAGEAVAAAVEAQTGSGRGAVAGRRADPGADGPAHRGGRRARRRLFRDRGESGGPVDGDRSRWAGAVLSGDGGSGRRRCSFAGSGRHRLRDLRRPEDRFQVGEGLFPPLRSVDAVPTNLPVVATELIGRDEEIAELTVLIGSRRLVTLSGTGGVGKTRLALAVAGAVAAGFPDGCWLVELAPVAAPEEVPRAVATAVAAPSSDSAGLVRYLGDRRLLLVLDNCEHVAAAAGSLVEKVLAAGSEPTMIVTSRVPLGVLGEMVHPVPSLGLPDPDAGVADAADADAVRLFVERAVEASGRFELDDANVAAVVEICRRLDGIPLAIEMAAARVRALPAQEIAARLGERLKWSRRPGDRQHTLQATINWSHGLLGVDDQVVFRRLGVFPASFDLAAAVVVAGDDRLDVTEAVVRLVDCSLVQFEPEEGRYRLLETLRQYAEDRLADAGEIEEIRERHAAYFLALAGRLAPETMDSRYTGAKRALAAELDNLRSTAEWCERTEHWADLAGMALGLCNFLYGAAPTDARAWYDKSVEHADLLDPQVLSDVLGEMSWITATHMGDQLTADRLARESVELAGRAGLAEAPRAWLTLAITTLQADDNRGALDRSQHARWVAEARGDPVVASVATSLMGQAYAALGDAEGSVRLCLEALELAEATGQRDAIQAAVLDAAIPFLFTSTPDFAAALAIFERHAHIQRIDDAMAVWIDTIWGAALVGLGRRARSATWCAPSDWPTASGSRAPTTRHCPCLPSQPLAPAGFGKRRHLSATATRRPPPRAPGGCG